MLNGTGLKVGGGHWLCEKSQCRLAGVQISHTQACAKIEPHSELFKAVRPQAVGAWAHKLLQRTISREGSDQR